eukprot:4745375-Pyramimonas_sp.AAC.1
MVHTPGNKFFEWMEGKGPAPMECLEHKEMSKDEKREFLKTAKTVRAHPWNLLSGAEYLEALVRRGADTTPNPVMAPDIDFYKTYSRTCVPILPDQFEN